MNRIFKVVWSKAVGQWVVTSEFGVAAGARTRRSRTARLGSGPLATLTLMTALALYGSSAMAAVDIVNGGFESGTLQGWTYSVTGNQSATGYSSDGGTGASVVTGVTNFRPGGNGPWTATPAGQYMASLQASMSSDQFNTGANALGLTASSQENIATVLNGIPTTSSWLYQDLALSAGDYFTMAWQYISTDNQSFNDASLTSLVNLGDSSIFATVNNLQAQYALLGATKPGTGSYSTGSYAATGWQVATYQVSVAGTYRLGFLSFNLDDEIASPVLLVDNGTGMTYKGNDPFLPVAPNPGSGAPVTPTQPTGPVVIDGPTGTDDLGSADTAEFAGGTLVVDKDTTVAQQLLIDDKPATIDQNGHTSTFTGTIDDASAGTPGTLTITNSGSGGSVILTGNNGYTGSTLVDEGASLALAGNGSISNSAKVTVDGSLDASQTTTPVSVTSLAGKGQVQLGTSDLSITAGNDTFTGTLAGQGGVSIEGGTQVFSGSNTYAGGTSISNQAVLQVGQDENLGQAAGTLTLNDGTLHTTGSLQSDRDVLLDGEGRFLTDAGTTLSNSGNVSGNGGLVKNGEGAMALTGTLAHAGGTTVNDGVMTLTGSNSYTGGTTLNGGVLQVLGDANLGDATGALTFNGGSLDTFGDMSSTR
ncbi:ESPR-type extended signal peptide-containing protein, partial [Stenotrophomonas sp. C3(2023)]|uniref:autotransporter-associated beta strand repeat-containing protein n=1 Tax=Stenotrophomonas sp. C3(2023) TaxID=3080277 RepID=UPI00293C2238